MRRKLKRFLLKNEDTYRTNVDMSGETAEAGLFCMDSVGFKR